MTPPENAACDCFQSGNLAHAKDCPAAKFKTLPGYAQVPKHEFKRLRAELARTADAAAFDFTGVWNLMIDMIEERHARVLAGTSSQELTLRRAVATLQQDMAAERLKMEREKRSGNQPQ